MNASVREVFQLSERCFSVAGFPEGPAHAAAEAIWWTEAYKGAGLTTLHDLLDELSEWDRDRVSLRERGSLVAVIDSDEQPGLVASSPTLDLACMQADQHGVGIAYTPITRKDETSHTLGHLACKAVKRGYLPVVLSTDGDTSRTIVGMPTKPGPRIVETTLDAPSTAVAAVTDVVEAGLLQRRHDPVTQAFFTEDEGVQVQDPVAEQRLLRRMLRRAHDPAPARSDVGPVFVLLCFDPQHQHTPEGATQVMESFLDDQQADVGTVYDPVAISERARTLLHEGVEVEDAVWADIFDYSSRILAPEFEGSYRGAGFNINE